MAHDLHTESAPSNTWQRRVVACLLAILVASCGGGDPSTDTEPVTMQASIVTGADGASVAFTPAEGQAAAALSITRADAGAPALPAGMQAAGAVYQFAPMGQVGNAIEIRVPFDGAQHSATPRLLVALAGEDSWSEIEAQPEGTTLRARVPALGYAVAARPSSVPGAQRLSATATKTATFLRGQLSAEPPLQGSGYLLTATAPSFATIRLDYSFGQSCAAPVQLRLRALVASSPSSTQPFSVRTVDLDTRALTASAGSETFGFPLTAASNGTWVFVADARCIEQGRVKYGLLTALPVLVVKIVNPPPPPPGEGSATIGAAGGFVTGPDGVRLGIPPAALDSDITFRIARDGSGAPPMPDGIELASPVYAITPHGQSFAVSASVELPVSATLAAGRPTFLMKAEPGGRWSVIGSNDGTATTLRAGIDSLSYLAIGVCQNNMPAGSVFAQACPSSHQLGLELLLNGATPVPVSQDTTYGAPIPVVTITTPETLTFRMTWTRPAGTNRVDTLDTGSAFTGSTLLRESGITFSSVAPRTLQVNENSFSRIFTVDVDPASVNGASGPNGVVRRIRAQAAYAVTGPGNIGSANWEFNAWVPIHVRAPVTSPVISSQPADVGVTEGQQATFTVAASISPAATLSYQWTRRSSGASGFTLIAGATAASLTLPAAQAADNGAQFRVEVCAGPSRCTTSNIATLTVTPVAGVPSFGTQPVDQTILAGQTASFSVVATGVPLPQIKWQLAAPNSTGFADIVGVAGCGVTNPAAGATDVAASCTIGPLTVADSGRRIRAMAINAAALGGVSSNVATVNVNAAGVAPAFTQQPQSRTAPAGGTATFTYAATGTSPMSVTWRINGENLNGSGEFDLGGCTGTATLGASSLTLSGIGAACNGSSIAVFLSNGVGPGVTSDAATLTVTTSAAPLWYGTTVALDYSTGLDLPQVGIARGVGAAVLDNGTLRLLGLASPASITGVASLRPQVIGAPDGLLSAVLYAVDTTAGSCPTGSELRAVVIYTGSEGENAVSPVITLFTAPAATCVGQASGAQTPRGFEFAVTTLAGTAAAGTFWNSYNPLNQVWNTPTATSAPLTVPTPCGVGGSGLGEGRMAGLYDAGIGTATATPSRIAVLAFNGFNGFNPTQRFTCTAMLAADGTWSPGPVWDNGVYDPLHADGPIISDQVVAMDGSGNALLAGSRRAGGQYELARAFLPAGATQWQIEAPLPAFGPVLPALVFDRLGNAMLLYRTEPAAGAAYTTVYAARRDAAGSWQPRTRLIGQSGDTRFPRLSMARNGDVLALFSYQTAGVFQVYSAAYTGGQWSEAVAVNPAGAAEGRFAVAARYYGADVNGRLTNLRAYWREPDPANAARSRIMRADYFR